jgi:hypothetical protein
MVRGPALATQTFAGSGLIRQLPPATLFQDVYDHPSTQFLLVAERRCCVSTGEGPVPVVCFTLDKLQQAGFSLCAGAILADATHDREPCPLSYLGHTVAHGGHGKHTHFVAADISAALLDGEAPLLSCRLSAAKLKLVDARTLVAQLPAAQLAIAGLAVALSTWHRVGVEGDSAQQ